MPTRVLGWATDPRSYGNPSEGYISWLKKLFVWRQLEEARSCLYAAKNITSCNLSVDSSTKKYVIL
jgi:hypothetical protein